MCHQAADEMHVTTQPTELRNHDRRPYFAGSFDRGCQLRAALQRVITFRRLDLLEGLDQRIALGLGKPHERSLLCLKAQAGFALPLGRNADVSDCGLHGCLQCNTATSVGMLHLSAVTRQWPCYALVSGKEKARRKPG